MDLSTRTWTADNGNGTFSNPLFFDEFSDPDMIRVGDDYYLTGTTMHTMPGLPVLHSRDLVNWRFLRYAVDRLDFGPEYRLEQGKEIYGQGIWAPCFRHHKGVFYIFSNIRNQPMQIFHTTDPSGPWTQTAMKRGFHDPSVLFDDDDKVYILWGYRDLRFAQLNNDLTDIVPGTEKTLFSSDSLMGEGVHFYKINGRYYILSAWYLGTMRMPCARADKPEGPYEVLEAISMAEDFGLAKGAMHQGGIVDTVSGEWWGYSMMDMNSIGRLTGLSPITWQDGWPYFGLPGNLGRSPRTWVKPTTGRVSPPAAPYKRSDDFAGPTLSPIWQWNHLPDDTKWSLTERPGYLRLRSLPALDFWSARNTLTQRAIGIESIVTTELDISGMQSGDIAGLALLNLPYAWIGVKSENNQRVIVQYDKATGKTVSPPLPLPESVMRVWLRVSCDFLTEKATFSYSVDGKMFSVLGDIFTMVFQLKTFQGVRYSLFHYNSAGSPGGYADFDGLNVDEPKPGGFRKPIPIGQTLILASADDSMHLSFKDGFLLPAPESDRTAKAVPFEVSERGAGRVAFRTGDQFLSVSPSGEVTLSPGEPGAGETFQWIETLQGELTLLSLMTHRYLRFDRDKGRVYADHPGPQRRQTGGPRLRWQIVSE